MSDERKHETGFLNTPNAEPMQERKPRKHTGILGQDARLQVKVGDKTLAVDITDSMMVGRAVEGDDTVYALDLGEFGGYQSGVSRQHALITRHEGGLYIEDLGSTNGTFVNGKRIAKITTVTHRDKVRLGKTITFEVKQLVSK